MDITDWLNISYKSLQDRKQFGSKLGYILDESLSDNDNTIFYNPNASPEKKLVMLVAGTHTLKDIGTDIYLALGRLKDTERYKRSKSILTQAKQKYNTNVATLIGHSLGGTTIGYIASPQDKVYEYNKGVTLGQKTRPFANSYRTSGDIISVLGDKKIKTFKNGSVLKNVGISSAMGLINPLVGGVNLVRNFKSYHDIDRIKGKIRF